MKAQPITLPSGYSVFSDDIRDEIGGKKTLVGVYNNVLITNTEFPFIMPTFGLTTIIRLNPQKLPRSLKLQIYFPGDDDNHPTIENPVPIDKMSIQAEPSFSNEPDAQEVISLTMHLRLSPLQIKQAGWIKVRAIYGRKKIRLGALLIRRNLDIQSSTE